MGFGKLVEMLSIFPIELQNIVIVRYDFQKWTCLPALLYIEVGVSWLKYGE